MIENNMYRGGCMVLLQALLTQACRTILAFCVVTNNSTSLNLRLVAMASSYVATSEAASLIENMGKHVLLTAVHFLYCEHHPHRACQHYHGEIAAAVGAVLQNSSLRSSIIAALTEFITRKWKKDEDSIAPLLRCALSAGPIEYLTTHSASESLKAPLMLLLQVFPELARSGASAEVACGCPHQWFRETLPFALLTMSMEQHARTWRRTSLLLMAFVRWQQRHGMHLLRGLASYTTSPPKESATQVPSTVSSEHAEWPAALQLQDAALKQAPTCGGSRNMNTNINKSCSGSSLALTQNFEKVFVEANTIGQAVVPRTEASPVKSKLDAATITDAHASAKLLRSLFLECDKLTSLRLKRQTFQIWRDVRLVERCNLKRIIFQSMWRRKQLCWVQWRHRMECRRIANRKKCATEQCHNLIERKRERLRQQAWRCWKASFLVRQFRIHTSGRRFFGVWRCAYIFAIHVQGKALPLIAKRALALRCLERWREVYLGHVADRMLMQRSFLHIKNYLRRRLEGRQLDEIARAHARRFLQQSCLNQWRKMYRLFLMYSQFTQALGRRLLYHTLLIWRRHWVRKIGGIGRMQTYLAIKQRRRIVYTFTHWKRKTHLKQLHQQLVFNRLRRTCHVLWNRWVQRVLFHQGIEKDRVALAVFMHHRFLLFGTWRLWRWRCVRREENRCAMDKAALILQAKVMHENQLLASAWYRWKGKSHLMRQRCPVGGFVPSSLNTYLGVNRSFPRANMSTISSPSRRTGNIQGFSVSFAEPRLTPPRRDPLAALRAERVLLQGIESPRWQSKAQSRLFDASRSEISVWNSPEPWRRCKEEARTIIMMPSDVEDDNSPSAESSHVLL
ncbi:hypothetical protein TraAM80_02373 [Trypanosoma rangeli]|uniref:Uncharacterized protein n=1 Tax=Trypanosoma rangeli TaxID=5698 RepID=A0A422NU31_TRYRA|nr:uncharacterized protein TraAM80_02373 [Trypanosoma rangeli]RNF08965.1 hypothetical protein TraAM80_02373 [Trypanosoma rangeli]|eukprot:RNF08965.1 hypothetical protein TraAM80_02373 [Trypanosoma rangeli]